MNLLEWIERIHSYLTSSCIWLHTVWSCHWVLLAPAIWCRQIPVHREEIRESLAQRFCLLSLRRQMEDDTLEVESKPKQQKRVVWQSYVQAGCGRWRMLACCSGSDLWDGCRHGSRSGSWWSGPVWKWPWTLWSWLWTPSSDSCPSLGLTWCKSWEGWMMCLQN